MLRSYDEEMRYAPVSRNEEEDVGEEEEYQIPVDTTVSRKGRMAGAAVVLLAITALAGAVVVPVARTVARDVGILDEEGAVSKSEVFAVSNEYERARGYALNDGLFEHMVQVHKSTRLELASGRPALFSVEQTPGQGDFAGVNADGAPFVEHIFSNYGVYRVTAVVEDPNGGDAESHDFTVTAKVIRYEVRDLSETDRTLYFDTLHKYYATGQKDGEALYGEDYKSLAYLVREHLYGAADKSCDHWHDDAGILTHHVGITWEMETSLRMISPATAAHYWDYTREEAMGVEWYDSPIFGDDWYGSNSPSNADHVVDTGRFAYTPVMSARGFSDTTNPYGLLRSPWNTNPTPYLLRSNLTFYSHADGDTAFPSCAQFAAYVNSSLAEVLYALNGELHGPVHIMIGGHWGNKESWKPVGTAMTFDDKFLLLSKWLWRQGFVRTPDSCSSDVPGDECMPVCPEAIVGTLTNESAYAILANTGVLSLNPSGSALHTHFQDAGLDFKDFLVELCHVGWPGDMFTSSAPQDPTFWPLHGNAERFVQYLRVLKKWDVVGFDETWGYHHTTGVPSDTGMVCDWSEVKDVSDMPTCVKDTCPGHKEDDLLPFTKLYKDQGPDFLTNAQLYSRIDPYHDDMPYAYDSLSYWAGCQDNNLLYEFNDLYGASLPVDKGMTPASGNSAGSGSGSSSAGDDAGVAKGEAAEKAEEESIRNGEEGPKAAYQWWGVM